MQFIGLFLAAIVVEGIVSYSKLIFVDKRFQWQNVAAIGLGVIIALAYRIDLFDIAGLAATIPYVGTVLTGILLSRGSNYIYEIIKKITAVF